jgi:hypothetical protein
MGMILILLKRIKNQGIYSKTGFPESAVTYHKGQDSCLKFLSLFWLLFFSVAIFFEHVFISFL